MAQKEILPRKNAMITKKMTLFLVALTATSLGGLTLSPAFGDPGPKKEKFKKEGKQQEETAIEGAQPQNNPQDVPTTQGETEYPQNIKNQPEQQVGSGLELVAVAKQKGLFVVEGKVTKDGKARFVRVLYQPQSYKGKIPPDWSQQGFSLSHETNHRNNPKNKKSGAIRWTGWHKMVDKRVEMLIDPEGNLVTWKEIGTGRRMVRGVKKFFGGGTALFSSSRKKANKADSE